MNEHQLDDLKASIEKAHERLTKARIFEDEQTARAWVVGELSYLAHLQRELIAHYEAQLAAKVVTHE